MKLRISLFGKVPTLLVPLGIAVGISYVTGQDIDYYVGFIMVLVVFMCNLYLFNRHPKTGYRKWSKRFSTSAMAVGLAISIAFAIEMIFFRSGQDVYASEIRMMCGVAGVCLWSIMSYKINLRVHPDLDFSHIKQAFDVSYPAPPVRMKMIFGEGNVFTNMISHFRKTQHDHDAHAHGEHGDNHHH